MLPLTLTILSAAVPPEKRGLALGAWGGIGGLAIAFGPVVGGAVVQGFSWQWIFWLNVPIGMLLVPLALSRLEETYGSGGKLDLPGLGLVSVGLFGIVWGLIRGNGQGWASTEIVTALAAGIAFVALFVAWELRATSPMLPMRLFRNAAFSLANLASLFMFFGMFGSIFLLAQFFQTIQGYSPLQSGLRILPVDARAHVHRADRRSALGQDPRQEHHRCGSDAAGGALAWIAAVSTPTTPYSHLVAPVHRSPGSAWRSSSRPSRTSCSLRCGRRKRARRPARTTRSASSAESSASRCSRRSSLTPAATRRRRRSSTG